ncbi:1-acyl-sn-glycerol-3-phosphate acyltransferase [Allorhizobium sp. BGMRC 0089]|uniref:lysophospholipid acyltransferase family protein n=1 Tax=Allorhizobium sonneratiae TaxID=2934936 RepID=UPI0020332FDD|nr:lysophospholipid acyltransferase family protein [Allorhizobium sonneratiae]MCM2291558.1 1-acyl-sn-glycerol-3-phosphate acyltransferase [Allorhizobium sonneratiae]
MIIALRTFSLLLLLVVVTLVMLPFQLIGLAFDLKLRRVLPRYWHKVACFVIGVKVRVHGVPERRRPLMLAANHASWVDILALSSIADVAFIAKMEVAEWPIFGTLAKLQKSVFIRREDKRSSGEQASEIAGRMAGGEIVVLFPEGTTSDGNRVLPIKSSLFGAAALALPKSPDGVVYIQPVAIAYTGFHGMPMGRYHRPILSWPGDVTLGPHLMGIMRTMALEIDICFGEPIEYRASTNRKQVALQVETEIRRMLTEKLTGRVLG